MRYGVKKALKMGIILNRGKELRCDEPYPKQNIYEQNIRTELLLNTTSLEIIFPILKVNVSHFNNFFLLKHRDIYC